jgi:hypothetical protein
MQFMKFQILNIDKHVQTHNTNTNAHTFTSVANRVGTQCRQSLILYDVQQICCLNFFITYAQGTEIESRPCFSVTCKRYWPSVSDI